MRKNLIILIFFGTITFADMGSTMNIDAQIQQIRTASPAMRVELMNEFKKRLVQMNESERINAIKSLQTKPQVEDFNSMQNKTMQIETHKDIIQYQNMNQEQSVHQESQKNNNNNHQGHKSHQNFHDGRF
ncbi:hypothetical protein JHD47_00540 [Sulfurimonas sp. SAG-AH-194-L11]|nr:hypothetical protein [Sulfurimonas sp. SAG-AH-194-L11]MDF1876301.1 hypothetical protein [Sulfurimonas sp. SAG-AH-194-L11]